MLTNQRQWNKFFWGIIIFSAESLLQSVASESQSSKANRILSVHLIVCCYSFVTCERDLFFYLISMTKPYVFHPIRISRPILTIFGQCNRKKLLLAMMVCVCVCVCVYNSPWSRKSLELIATIVRQARGGHGQALTEDLAAICYK